jgi:Zn-finger nucleic acid-binding protein
MNCPSCGAPLHFRPNQEGLTCDYCKSTCFPEKNEDGVRLLDEDSKLCCPVCAVPLTNAVLETSAILYCKRCRGSLIATSVFVLLTEMLRAHRTGGAAIPQAPDPEELKRHIRCPQCHKPMDTHYYAGPGNVVIDDCPRCELNWLDAGELMSIARAPDHASACERLEPNWEGQ